MSLGLSFSRPHVLEYAPAASLPRALLTGFFSILLLSVIPPDQLTEIPPREVLKIVFFAAC